MKYMKKTAGVLLAVLMIGCLFTILSVPVSASVSGNCGADEYGHPSDKVKWEYNSTNRTLYFRGNGYMHYYGYYSDEVPWWDYRDEIENIVIENGVKSISDFAFCYFSRIKTLYFPGSVENIGYEAVYKCASLKRVTMDEGVQNVGKYAFYDCPKLTEVYIPASLKKLGYEAFCYSPLKVIRFGAYSAAERTYIDGGYTFYGCAADCKYLYNGDALHYAYSYNNHWRTDPYGEVHYGQTGHYYGENWWAPHTVEWEGSRCTATKTCQVCGYLYSVTGYGSYETDTPANCISPETGHYTARLVNIDTQTTPESSIRKGEKDPDAHGYEWVTVEAPTCIAGGVEKEICRFCKKERASRDLPASGIHDYGDWKVIKEASCKAAGEKERVCAVCGRKETEKWTEPHSFGAWKTTKSPTCILAGQKERVCALCGTVETVGIGKTDHVFVEVVKGNISYYQCSLCHNCFFAPDEGCPMGNPENDLPEMKTVYINGDGAQTAFPQAHLICNCGAGQITLGENGKTTWYLIGGEVTVEDRVDTVGEVHLVLMDGAELTCGNGICVRNRLSVYSQSMDEATMGSLTVPSAPSNCPGIGADTSKSISQIEITVFGGKLDVHGGTNGAGIGGGYQCMGSRIVVKNGVVKAVGGQSAAGIGGGAWNTTDETVIMVEKGTVTAEGGTGAAGIGGGVHNRKISVIINGGVVTADGGANGAGIGGGVQNEAKVVLNGGTVRAKKGEGDAEDIGRGTGGICPVEDNRTNPGGFTLSGGYLWIVIAGAVVIVGVMAAVAVAAKKKKRPARAGSAEKGDEE